MSNIPERVKICIQCKEYMFLFPDNPKNKEKEEFFDGKHWEHMLEILDIREFDKTKYTRFER